MDSASVPNCGTWKCKPIRRTDERDATAVCVSQGCLRFGVLGFRWGGQVPCLLRVETNLLQEFGCAAMHFETF